VLRAKATIPLIIVIFGLGVVIAACASTVFML
jgi:hypothetical protein